MMRSRHSLIAQPVAQAKAVRQKTFPAPTAGLVTVDSLIASRPNSAQRLENILPLQGSARIRRGSLLWQNILNPVVSMMAYRAVGLERLFANTADSIWDVTSSGGGVLLDQDNNVLLDDDDDPIIQFEVSAAITGLGSGYFSYVNFSNDGGHFLIAVNGTDPLQRYNGTDWSTTVAFTGTGINTNLLSFVSVYRNRLFFVEKGTMNFWYLGVNAISGAASKFPLSGVFDKGGSIMMLGTWSMDAGDGLDDKFVVISDQGEVAIYQGSDPSDDEDWFLVGRYEISPPLGPRATTRFGGDLMVATEEGLTPISAAVTKDTVQLSLSSASVNIEPEWTREARLRRSFNWEIVKNPQQNMAIVSLPTASDDVSQHYCFVVNVETGAWTTYTGWDIRCMEYFDGNIFFGTRDGRILQAEQGGDDDGRPYFPLWIGNWDDFGIQGKLKTVHQARATFLAQGEINPRISLSTDYTVKLPGFPDPPASLAAPSLWDEAEFDVDVWDGGGETKKTISTRWVSQGRTGYSHAVQLQMAQESEFAKEIEVVEVTMTYEVGALVI